jgi:uroporphyrinogen decarboxylase
MALIDELGIKPAPDFEGRMKKVLLRQGEPDRIPFYELFADKPIKDAILGKPTLVPSLLPFGEPIKLIPNEIEYWLRLGYDYVPAAPAYGFGMKVTTAPDTAEQSQGPRFWVNETSSGLIKNREDFEKYFWPEPEIVPFDVFDAFAKYLPEGMVLFGQTSGILENVTWLLGHEGMAYMLIDDPELLQMIFDKVGKNLVRMIEIMCEREFVGAIQMGDDMGFKTQTMISPKALRKFVFPWQKKAVEAAHKKGKPFILHSCGNLEKVMDDFVANGVDAKHSFEDQITPVAKAKKLWGKKMAVLGGIDLDFLCRASPEQVCERTRKMIRELGPGGGWALGTGNSVANYIPVKNFLAMIKTGWEAGRYPL